jgi:hypothetical protein
MAAPKENEMPISIDTIGIHNRALVLALARGNKSFSGALVSDFEHRHTYNYDAIGRKLTDGRTGVKYYCTTDGVSKDMRKTIVHILNLSEPNNRGKMEFYRLIHTKCGPWPERQLLPGPREHQRLG